MANIPMSPLQACTYLQWGYKDKSKLKPYFSLDIAGVQAHIFDHKEQLGLLVEGSNERQDWQRFNFRFWPKKSRGDSRKWHRGFLHYANIVYAFSKNEKLNFILGHSLGAAAVQIIGPSLKVPTLAVASPRPLYDRQPNGADVVQNLCRIDDSICYVPFKFWGYKHVGQVYWMKPKDRHIGEDHSIDHYIALLEDQGDPFG